MKVKKKSENVALKLNVQKMKIMASGPITSWEIDMKQWEQCQTLFLAALLSGYGAQAFSSCFEWGHFSSCAAGASHCGGFCYRAWNLGT